MINKEKHMGGKHWTTFGLVAVLLLGLPRASSAEWFDFVWEMSGAGVITVSGSCKIDLTNAQGCKDKHISLLAWGPRLHEDASGDQKGGHWPSLRADSNNKPKGDFKDPQTWITFNGSYGVSFRNTPKKADGIPFRTHMGSVETMLEHRLAGSASTFMVYQGVGTSFTAMVGNGFKAVYRSSIRIKPLGFKWVLSNRVEIGGGLNFRYFPDAFSANDFLSDDALQALVAGGGSLAAGILNPPGEWVPSISGGFTIPLPPL